MHMCDAFIHLGGKWVAIFSLITLEEQKLEYADVLQTWLRVN